MLVVSNYHYIRENFTTKFPSIFGLTPGEFRSQLEELAKAGDFISQQELLEFRNKKFDKNYILITFDDGLKEQFELAKPILDSMGIPYIFFINTSNFQEKNVSLVHKIHLVRSQLSSAEILNELSKTTEVTLSATEKALGILHYNYDEEKTAILKYLLNFKMSLPQQRLFIGPLFDKLFSESSVASKLYFDENMLQELHLQGVLGSHSHHHLPLGLLPKEELETELEKTQQFFKQKFGKPAVSISYPYGSREACNGIAKEVAAHGFQLGFTMERAANKSLKKNPLLLSRFDCNDMPRGKNQLFTANDLFKKPPLRTWQKNESSPAYKQ